MPLSPPALHLDSRIRGIYRQPLNDLLFQAQTVHRENFDPNRVQLSALLSIKTGGCPENCSYCPQSAHYQTGVAAEPLMEVAEVTAAARAAKENGASRFCLGGAWRSPKDQDVEQIAKMIGEIRALGLETCGTFGMLTATQAQRLQTAGLQYYNHNIDTSPEYYGAIISSRKFSDRIDTLKCVAEAGMKVCSGGIIGMGESEADRLKMLAVLHELPSPPQSIPLNLLIPIAGTPLAEAPPVDAIEFVRLVATARILFPTSYVRIAAGRETMADEFQALCFFAGANSVFLGDRLLTAANPAPDRDARLFEKLGMRTTPAHSPAAFAAEL